MYNLKIILKSLVTQAIDNVVLKSKRLSSHLSQIRGTVN